MAETMVPGSPPPEAPEPSAPLALAAMFQPVRPERRPPAGSAPTLSTPEKAIRRKRNLATISARPFNPHVDVRRRAVKNLQTHSWKGATVLTAEEALLHASVLERELFAEAKKTEEEDSGGRVRRRPMAQRKHATTAWAIAWDKVQLGKGLPTSITEHRLEEASPELQALARRLLALEGGSQP